MVKDLTPDAHSVRTYSTPFTANAWYDRRGFSFGSPPGLEWRVAALDWSVLTLVTFA